MSISNIQLAKSTNPETFDENNGIFIVIFCWPFFFCLTKNTHKTKHAKNKKRNTNILLKRGERRPIKKKNKTKKSHK